MKGRFLMFACLGCFILSSFLCAAAVPDDLTAYTEEAARAIAAKDFTKASAMAKDLKWRYPKSPAGYRIMIFMDWELKNIAPIVWEVFNAERVHGVRDAGLYVEQAKALYYLDGFQAALQALDSLETFLKERP